MKKRKGNPAENQLKISVPQPEANQRNTFPIINFILTTIVFITLSVTVLSMFNIQSVSATVLIPGVIITALYFTPVKRVRILLYSILVLGIVIAIALNNLLIEGILIIFNEISQSIGEGSGIILPVYHLTAEGQLHTLYASIAWVFLSAVILIAAGYIVQYSKAILYFLLMAGIYLFQGFFHTQADLWVNAALFIIGLIISYKSFFRYSEGKMVAGNRQSKIFAISALMLLVIISASVLLFTVLEPVTEYEKNEYAQNTEDFLVGQLEDARFEKGADSLTQGDLKNVEELELSDETALEVIMEKPASVYLRGYVGSEYKGDAWQDFDSSIYYENHNLFYWLNKEGFTPLNQLSMVNYLMPEDKQIGENSKMTVNNINANSKYLYTPYELSSSKAAFEDVNEFDDSMFKSTNFLGDRFYRYEINTELVTRYPALANELYANREENQTADYLEKEAYYNDYVYDLYTRLPEQVENIFEIRFESNDEQEEHPAYEEAIEFVRDYLNQTLTYTIEPAFLPEGQDFMVHLMERSQEGYSVHYATAATLMFRYAGIPARYIEGYLVTPRDIENKEPYEQIDVAGTNAHAWTEIYFDEIGWLPIEVTPPYYEMMEQTDISAYPDGDANDDNSGRTMEESQDGSEDNQQIADQPEDDKTTSQDEEENDEQANWPMIILLILLLMMMLVYFTYIVRMRMKIYHLNKSFKGPDFNKATMKLYSYTLKLLHQDGIKKRNGSVYSYEGDLQEKYGVSYAEEFKEVSKINQMAVYSGKDISEKDYHFVSKFKDETLENVLKTKNVFQRLKMRLWDFIY